MRSVRCLLRLQAACCQVQSLYRAAQNDASSWSAATRLLSVHHQLRHCHGNPKRGKGDPVPADVYDGNRKRQAAVVAQDDLFEQVSAGAKTKVAFNQAVDLFIKRDIRRRGHVEFIYAALKKMADFGVERELSVYNKLLDVFPKEVFVPRNFIQRMFNHYPRQQECGVQLLEQMEANGVLPNVETKVLLVQIFGEKGHPMRKYQRIMYWFPKFKHTNPFPVPLKLPDDEVDLASFSLLRMAGDLDAKVTVYQMPSDEITETGDLMSLPHIVGVQSPSQAELLSQHDPSRPVFVEGPFPLWLRKTCVHYYILRADPPAPGAHAKEPYDPERCLDYPLQLDLDLDRDLGDMESFDVDQVDEGPVFAMCMAGEGDQVTLGQWILGLQQTNPNLGRVPVLFRLEAKAKELRGPAGGHSEGRGQTRSRPLGEEEGPEDPEELMEESSRRRRGLKQ